MMITAKLSGSLYKSILTDLKRPHSYAAERVGFVLGRLSEGEQGPLLLLTRYHSIPDDQYVNDPAVGARIGPAAMTWAMQTAYSGRAAKEGLFHIHLHPHRGPTSMSRVDREGIPPMIPGFRNVAPNAPHGIIILSLNHGSCWVWLPARDGAHVASSIRVAGLPIRVFKAQSGS